MSDRLKGKRAFVTAAAAGIGRACAVAFAREGATVFATDIDERARGAARAKASRKRRGSTCATAQPSPPWPSASARSTSCSMPPASCITAPCWNAPTRTGISRSTSTSSRCTGRSRAFLPGMLENGGGSIVNISSAAGVFKAAPNRYVYGATKAAVAALTRAVAVDFITKGIRCNCICPGTIETPSMLERAAAAGPNGREMFVVAPADGPARHGGGNRLACGLSRQRRKRVHDRRRPHHRRRLDAVTTACSGEADTGFSK